VWFAYRANYNGASFWVFDGCDLVEPEQEDYGPLPVALGANGHVSVVDCVDVAGDSAPEMVISSQTYRLEDGTEKSRSVEVIRLEGTEVKRVAAWRPFEPADVPAVNRIRCKA
jgi:hypothetical protein